MNIMQVADLSMSNVSVGVMGWVRIFFLGKLRDNRRKRACFNPLHRARSEALGGNTIWLGKLVDCGKRVWGGTGGDTELPPGSSVPIVGLYDL